MAASRPSPPDRSAYRAFVPITTRWHDNDVYGHVNNVVYYSFFDTAVNRWLIDAGLLDVETAETIGLVVRTECDYFAPVAFPQSVEAGVAVERLGTSSVTYRVGIFADSDDAARAAGRFTHVYVGRQSRRPAPLPDAWRTALDELLVS
ncbi:acyl-CoA thioesterase [Rubrivirga marina]|uniref:Thioesterase n=1 Tax=Rubrivirga marina TaxID=1196024 RepID=A0A271IUS9_9BACT|nr:thioesterase family protein [Rubrivirga marina]PAP74996.1 thioesterase [Rubrivirga marina]